MMPVHVETVESSVELTGVPGAAGRGASSSLPTWQERERLRLAWELHERDAARLQGEGSGA